MHNYAGEQADLTLLLDVIFHLIEDDVFEEYMTKLFDSSNKFVIIYSSNTEDNTGYEGTHIKHRKFTDWVEKNRRNWSLIQYIHNRYPYKGNEKTGSFSNFYIFQKKE